MSSVPIITPDPPPPPPPPAPPKAGAAYVQVKSWWKSRTLWFNGLIGVVLTTLAANTDSLKEAFGEYGAIVVTCTIVGNAAFRFITEARLK